LQCELTNNKAKTIYIVGEISISRVELEKGQGAMNEIRFDGRPYLVFGERATATIHFEMKEEVGEDALIFASLDALTIHITPQNGKILQLGKSLRRMKSVESFQSTSTLATDMTSTSGLTIKSPTNLADGDGNKSLSYGKQVSPGNWILPLVIPLSSSEDISSSGIAKIQASIYQKKVKPPSIQQDTTFSSEFLSNMLRDQVSSITEIIKIGNQVYNGML
jgi:hypothetical protein